MPDETHAIIISRVFQAPRDRVFRAWTDPELLKRWVLRGTCKDAEVDLKVGGSASITGSLEVDGIVSMGVISYTGSGTQTWTPTTSMFVGTNFESLMRNRGINTNSVHRYSH